MFSPTIIQTACSTVLQHEGFAQLMHFSFKEKYLTFDIFKKGSKVQTLDVQYLSSVQAYEGIRQNGL